MDSTTVHHQTVTVDLENGLHMSPCSRIAEVARRFGGTIRIRNGNVVADARNVLDLMTLQAEYGTQLDLEASGDGAVEALDALVRLFESKFQVGP